jgi:pantetheine-phosphate adenylyltransferase
MISFKDTLKNYEKLSFAKQFEAEREIFLQYQHHDFLEYKKARLAHLKKINADKKLNALIDYVNQFEPRIAVFAGSFSPFHKGHYNVLQKAERIFDKVIVAFGKNPSKEKQNWNIPKTIKNRQLCEYNGLLTDFIKSLKYDVTVVRGLRNSTDFQYEQNQYRYIQELKPDIKIVNIFCDKEFEHISSSGIRTLEQFNKHKQYLLD